MKKAIKLWSLLTVLVLVLSLFSGCTEANMDTDEEDLSILKMTVGVPADSSSPNWDEWRELMQTWVQDFKDYYYIDLNIVSVPTDEEGLEKFIKKVKRGQVSCFVGSSDETVNKLIEKEAIYKVETIVGEYTALLESVPAGVQTLSLEDDSFLWMMPLYGTYQGVFYNPELFEKNQIAVPTDWASLLTAIDQFKALGITPISAGFADKGLGYMVDELVLSEGGTAEHSYQPTFGTVSSWERAVAELKNLEAVGAFTPDCYNVTFDTALENFLNGSAAMIVAPATEMEGEIDPDSVEVMGLPATPGGQREKGAFVGDVEHGVYVSTNTYQKKNIRFAEALVMLMGEDYFGSPEFYNLVKSDSTFCANTAYFYGGEEENALEESVGKMLGESAAADLSMSQNLKTYDNLIDAFRKVLKGADMETELLAAAKAEIAAQNETAEAK